jgi:hypothetical protein
MAATAVPKLGDIAIKHKSHKGSEAQNLLLAGSVRVKFIL